jgi:hypothetical protein
MSINSQTTLQELINLGFIKEADIQKWNKRIENKSKSSEKKALVEGTKSAILSLLDAEIETSNVYWSVKPAAHSQGFTQYIETDRGIILKALTQLVADGQVIKVGLKKVGDKLVELPVTEVNSFQLRYKRATEVSPE